MPFVEVGGARVHFAAAGAVDRAIPPAILIHGAAASGLAWGLQLSALGSGGRVIVPDLPGHGRSAPPGRDSIEGYRDFILAFLDALALERATLVGHSMGGAIAQSLALSRPERLAALVLVATGARLRVSPALLEGMETDIAAASELVVDFCYAPSTAPGLREKALAELRACPPETILGDFRACDSFDLRAAIGAIAAPTLVIAGTEDRMMPFKYAEFLAAGIPGSRLVAIEGAGHALTLERPAEVNEAILDFLRAVGWGAGPNPGRT